MPAPEHLTGRAKQAWYLANEPIKRSVTFELTLTFDCISEHTALMRGGEDFIDWLAAHIYSGNIKFGTGSPGGPSAKLYSLKADGVTKVLEDKYFSKRA